MFVPRDEERSDVSEMTPRPLTDLHMWDEKAEGREGGKVLA